MSSTKFTGQSTEPLWFSSKSKDRTLKMMTDEKNEVGLQLLLSLLIISLISCITV